MENKRKRGRNASRKEMGIKKEMKEKRMKREVKRSKLKGGGLVRIRGNQKLRNE
jgi:hypothetical protein